MTLTIISLLGGLVALFIGGELLVRGAVGLAERARVTPLMIGLVIVGFGTSMPELVTSVEAALAGSPAIAWGNVVGSNIANTLLILGGAALLAPIAVRQSAALRDSGMALLASLALLAIASVQIAGIWLGIAMVAALGAYIAYCYREERAAAPASVHNAAYDKATALEMSDAQLHGDAGSWAKPVLLTLAGLVLLVVGGRFLVSAAIELAQLAGLSETFIGLTIVAIGTSLPELVTSLVAARKGETEVAFGNVVGSNIYNILGIGGVTMMVAPLPIPDALLPLDLGLMAISAIAVVVAIALAKGVGRVAGGLFVAGYGLFLAGAVMQG